MVLHKPGVSVGLVVPEGGEGPCRYVLGLVGPHDVRRWMASWFPSERRTSSYGDVFRPVPRGHLVGGGSCQHHRCGLPLILESLIVLDVPIVELLVVIVEIPDVPDVELLVDVIKIASRLGEGFLGAAAAVGPIVLAAVGPIVLAAVALGLARASRDGRARRFVASSIKLLIVVFLDRSQRSDAQVHRCRHHPRRAPPPPSQDRKLRRTPG